MFAATSKIVDKVGSNNYGSAEMLIDRALKDDINSLTNDCQVICILNVRCSIDHGQRLSLALKVRVGK